MFVEQYIVNKVPSLVSYDLFDVRQYQGESLKDFLNRFGAQIVRLPGKDEEMFVHAFKKGVLPGLFSESLIRSHPATFAEIRRRAVAHIAAESEVSEKRMVRKPWMCMSKILLRAMVILKVHGMYESWEVRPAQCEVKDVKIRA